MTATTIKLTVCEKAVQSVDSRTARLDATKERADRICGRKSNRLDTLKAKRAELDAQIAQGEQELADSQEYHAALIRKQEEEVKAAQDWLTHVRARQAKKVAQVTKVVPINSGGTIETDKGETLPIKNRTASIVRGLVNAKSGHLDDFDSITLLKNLDIDLGGDHMEDVESFIVTLKGRKAALMFTLLRDKKEAGTIRFETTKAMPKK